MPRRRAAPLEQRLREYVAKQVPEHGDRKPFAKRIRRGGGWLTSYLLGNTHPDLDTTVALALACDPALSAEQVTGLEALPDVDRLTKEMMQAWASLSDEYRQHLIALATAFVGTRPEAPRSRTAPRPVGQKAAKPRTDRRTRAGGE